MNFLAHIYLSGEYDNIKIGNFIADGVKGKQFEEFSDEIKKGIVLHRQIDNFTDKHLIVKKSKKRLHKRYRHYDGVIIDIFYDHFLAKNWDIYSQIPLNIYTKNFYRLLDANYPILPQKIKNMMPSLVKDNWLYNYRSIIGIEKVLSGMNSRTKFNSYMDVAVEDLILNYAEFEGDFTLFFEKLRIFSAEKISALKS
jgi:acyl carrier protein phosphodiesterase